MSVFHTDFGLQALAKLQRGFDQDLQDVRAMIARGLTSPQQIQATFAAIEDQLYRTPIVDRDRLRAAVLAIG